MLLEQRSRHLLSNRRPRIPGKATACKKLFELRFEDALLLGVDAPQDAVGRSGDRGVGRTGSRRTA
jgi:hypothetical protein